MQLSVQLCPESSTPSALHVPHEPLTDKWTPSHIFCERSSFQTSPGAMPMRTRPRSAPAAVITLRRRGARTTHCDEFVSVPSMQLGRVPRSLKPGKHSKSQDAPDGRLPLTRLHVPHAAWLGSARGQATAISTVLCVSGGCDRAWQGACMLCAQWLLQWRRRSVTLAS